MNTKVNYAPREIIENKLMLALEGEGVVAALLTKNDINTLIGALEDAPCLRGTHRASLLRDLRRLAEELP